MAYFPDLAPFTGLSGRDLIAVGWLDADQPFSTGELSSAIRIRLNRQVFLGGPPRTTRSERCPLCGSIDLAGANGAAHSFVAAPDALYVAPTLLPHFIYAHRYRPPQRFLDALAAAPEATDPEYAAALARHGVPWPPPPPRREYTAEDITVLEGLEPVRLRAGMYIGDTHARGLEHLVMEVVGNSLDQVLGDCANSIRVDVADDGWVEVEDDGCGISVAPHPRTGRSAIELIFTTLHSGPTFDGHRHHVHVTAGLHGVGLSVVNALSVSTTVNVFAEGQAWEIAFSRGAVTEPLRQLGATAKRGTRVRFLPDEQIFNDARLDLPALEERLSNIARLLPNLKLTFRGRDLSKPLGCAGWVQELAPVVRETVLTARATVDEIDVEFALGWSAALEAPLVRSFTNLVPTPEGGTHQKALLRALPLTTKDERLRAAIRDGLAAIVHVRMLHPQFGGPTRSHLASVEAGPAVTRVVREAVAKAPWFWDAIHSAVR